MNWQIEGAHRTCVPRRMRLSIRDTIFAVVLDSEGEVSNGAK